MLVGGTVLFASAFDVGIPLPLLAVAVLVLAAGTVVVGLGGSLDADRPADV